MKKYEITPNDIVKSRQKYWQVHIPTAKRVRLTPQMVSRGEWAACGQSRPFSIEAVKREARLIQHFRYENLI